ncbi:MAG: hypothetical protein IPK83_22790 [Planctomycetes bacterium]|nr:hypothetical protein [Planctomycetota bacterium]
MAGLHNSSMGVFQFTPTPWATGVPINYTPGNQPTPFDVEFTVNLDESCGEVRRYFQDQLDRGRIIVIVTSLSETFIQAGEGFPSFFLNTGVPGANPYPARLDIVLASARPGDMDADGDVDETDLALFAATLLNPTAATQDHRDRSDLNGDGVSNGEDISQFVAAYLGNGC